MKNSSFVYVLPVPCSCQFQPRVSYIGEDIPQLEIFALHAAAACGFALEYAAMIKHFLFTRMESATLPRQNVNIITQTIRRQQSDRPFLMMYMTTHFQPTRCHRAPDHAISLIILAEWRMPYLIDRNERQNLNRRDLASLRAPIQPRSSLVVHNVAHSNQISDFWLWVRVIAVRLALFWV